MNHIAHNRANDTSQRLIDKLIGYSAPVTIISNDRRRTYTLPGAAEIAASLEATPTRYVLDKDVTRFCTELACRSAVFLEQCLDLVRLPTEQFWVEFDEDERLATLARQAPGRYAQQGDHVRPAGPSGRRFGMLVVANGDSTRGCAQVCWSQSAADLHPEVSPARLQFDLRDRAAPDPGDSANGLAHLANPLQSVAGLNAFARLKVEPLWLAYYKAEASTPAQYSAAMAGLSAQMWFDWVLLLSFLVCLNVKDGFTQKPVTAAPAKFHPRRPLAPSRPSHIEVTSSLFGDSPNTSHASYGFGGGKRLHYVRGHLVRRKGRIFWRSSHMRGNLAVAPPDARTVSMRLTRAR